MRLFDLIRASTRNEVGGYEIDTWYRNPNTDHFELGCGDTVEFHFADQDVQLGEGQCEATYVKVIGDEAETFEEGPAPVWITFYVERMLKAEDI